MSFCGPAAPLTFPREGAGFWETGRTALRLPSSQDLPGQLGLDPRSTHTSTLSPDVPVYIWVSL